MAGCLEVRSTVYVDACGKRWPTWMDLRFYHISRTFCGNHMLINGACGWTSPFQRTDRVLLQNPICWRWAKESFPTSWISTCLSVYWMHLELNTEGFESISTLWEWTFWSDSHVVVLSGGAVLGALSLMLRQGFLSKNTRDSVAWLHETRFSAIHATLLDMNSEQ